MKMTDTRLIECYHLDTNGDYIGVVPVCLDNKRFVQLEYRQNNKWYLVMQAFDKYVSQWNYEVYGPLNSPIKTYEAFKDKVMSINTLTNDTEPIQEFLETYYQYKSKQLAEIAKRI